MRTKTFILFGLGALFIWLLVTRTDVYAQYPNTPTPGGATPTPGGATATPGGPTPTPGGGGSCASTCTGQDADGTCTGCSSTTCDNDCQGRPVDCPENPNGGSCGGHQNCPAPAGQCAEVSGGITIGADGCNAGGTTCWTTCCNGNPTPTPAPTSSPAPTPAGCGSGGCGAGESCANCSADCGACPTPAPTLAPGETPAPTEPPPATCGNGTCGAGENCSNCSTDCGACPATPTPAGGIIQIQSRAVMMNATDDCTAVRASTTAIPGASPIHSFTIAPAPSPAPLTQSGTNYVSFPPSTAGTYAISVAGIPQNYVIKKACYLTASPATSGEALTLLLTDGETLRWDLGYTLGTAWVQTQAGDVYASGVLKTLVPNGISPRVFNLDSSVLYPGVVTYGSSYDFDIGPGTGPNLVSSKNWLANESYGNVDYYQTFWHRFGAPTTFTYTNPSFVSPPAACDGSACYISGTLTVSEDWTIGSGSYVFIIDGDLAINSKINLSGTGFVAFIVKNNITVSSSVGVAYTSSVPVVEGIYITSPTGTFHTGASVSGTERFVGKGIFVAGDFRLQRDLEGIAGGQNTTTSSELFLYNPRLLVTMPDAMKDLPVTWEEVAP